LPGCRRDGAKLGYAALLRKELQAGPSWLDGTSRTTISER